MAELSITVVTACRNAVKFLPQCLASVREAGELAQASMKSPDLIDRIVIEHLVSDAESTDGSVDVLHDWKASASQPSESPISYSFAFVSEPDSGQCDGFNKGVLKAKGNWICWLNADDELTPQAVLAFISALRRRPQADVVYGHVQFVDELSRPAWICYHLPFVYGLIANACYVPPSSGSFFRRELLVREPLDTNLHYVMDVEWFLRCGTRIRAELVDEIFSRFRLSPDAKTSAMVRTGVLRAKHASEREEVRAAHIYSRWPSVSRSVAARRLEVHSRLWKILYLLLKLRYVGRYGLAAITGARQRR